MLAPVRARTTCPRANAIFHDRTHRPASMLINAFRPVARVNCVAVSPNARYVACGSVDNAVGLVEAATGELRRLEGHAGEVTAVAFSSDGTRIASGSWDRTLRLWDVASGREIACLGEHFDDVTAAVFSPDDRELLSYGRDGILRLWNIATARGISHYHFKNEAFLTAAFSPDGEYVAAACSDRILRLWTLDTGACRHLKGHAGAVNAVAFSPDGRQLVSGSTDRTVRFWEPARGSEIARFAGPGEAMLDLAFSADAQHVIYGCRDGTVRLCRIGGTARLTEAVRFDAGEPFACLAIAMGGQAGVAGDARGRIHLVDIPANDPDGAAWLRGFPAAGTKEPMEPGLAAAASRQVDRRARLSLPGQRRLQPPTNDDRKVEVLGHWRSQFRDGQARAAFNAAARRREAAKPHAQSLREAEEAYDDARAALDHAQRNGGDIARARRLIARARRRIDALRAAADEPD